MIDIARRNRVRSPLRIDQTAIWQVNELMISRTVAGPTNGMIWREWANSSGGQTNPRLAS